MKPISIFVLVAAVSLFTVAASAKNGTAPGNMDERVIAQVAGPPAAAQNSKRTAERAAKAEKVKKAKDEQQKTAPRTSH